VSRLDGPNAVTDADALDDAGAVAGRICDSPPLCATLAWDVFLWNGALHRFQVPQGTRASVAATAADRVAGTLLGTRGGAAVVRGLLDMSPLRESLAARLDCTGIDANIVGSSPPATTSWNWKRSAGTASSMR